MTQNVFEQQIALFLERLDELWQRATQLVKPTEEQWEKADEVLPQQQELLRESLEEFSQCVAKLQIAAETLGKQDEELATSRIVVEAERQRYQNLFEFVPDSYLITNLEGVILEANQTAAQLLNIAQKLLIHKPLVALLATEELHNYYSKLFKLRRGESIPDWQIQIQRQDSSSFLASLTVTPLKDRRGQVVSFCWHLRELSVPWNPGTTQQPDVSEAAFQEEYLFSSMFERASVGIALLDSQGRVIKSNRTLQEMLGYSFDKLQTVFPKLMNLDKTGVESALFKQLMGRRHRSYQLKKCFLNRHQRVKWARLVVSLVQGTDNEPNFAICILEDITEQRQFEQVQRQVVKRLNVNNRQERTSGCNAVEETNCKQAVASIQNLETLLDGILSNSSDLFLICDRAGKFLYVNQAVAQAFGLAPSDFIGRSWWQLNFPMEIIERLDAQREAVFVMGQSFTDEASLPTVEGLKDYEYRMTRLNNIDSSPEALVVTFKDLTEHKRAVAAATEALVKEEKFTALKAHLAFAVTHELRIPLNKILCYSQLAEGYTQQKTDEQKLQYLEKKLKYLQHIPIFAREIEQRLDNLVSLGKIGAGKLHLNLAPLNLTDFCQELIEELQQGVGSQHKLLLVGYARYLSVPMDKTLLRRILINLLINAIKYSPQGSSIYLEVVCQAGQAIFRIRDPGIGIPQEDQELIFNAFHRGSNVGQILGNGLGLTIVKECVDLHKGRIFVESKLGVGTTFTVALPLNRRWLRRTGSD